MIIYNFQNYLNNDVEIYNSNKQVKRYFSEVLQLKELKKFNLKEQHILVLLGGKNFGKSYWALLEMMDVVKKGGRGCYMRNTLNEIKAMKSKLAELVKLTLNEDVRVSDEGVFNWDRTKTYINFVQSKNYNKLSGNQSGYDILIYDEFNQTMTENEQVKIQADFFNIINTIFRNKTVRIIACGNTKTKNNVFFNLFRIKPESLNNNLQIIKIKDSPIIFLSYLDSLFKELNGNVEDYKIFKKYDVLNYNMMFSGTSYESDDDSIINNFDSVKHLFKQTNKIILKENRLYQIWEYNEDKTVWLIEKTATPVNLELLNRLKSLNFVIYSYDIEDYYNQIEDLILLTNNNQIFIDKLRQFKLFFNSYEIYNFIKSDSEVLTEWYKKIGTN